MPTSVLFSWNQFTSKHMIFGDFSWIRQFFVPHMTSRWLPWYCRGTVLRRQVGGDQVWAYHPSCTAGTPPASQCLILELLQGTMVDAIVSSHHRMTKIAFFEKFKGIPTNEPAHLPLLSWVGGGSKTYTPCKGIPNIIFQGLCLFFRGNTTWTKWIWEKKHIICRVEAW